VDAEPFASEDVHSGELLVPSICIKVSELSRRQIYVGQKGKAAESLVFSSGRHEVILELLHALATVLIGIAHVVEKADRAPYHLTIKQRLYVSPAIRSSLRAART